MRSPTGRVLVLGSDARMVLAILRSLGRRGLEVDLAWGEWAGPALRSRYLCRVHRLPPPADRGPDWVGPLRALLAEGRYDLVVPATDIVAVALQSKKDALASNPEVCLLGDRAFAAVSDKDATRAVAISLGIPVPETRRIERGVGREGLDRGVLERLAATRFPAIVKPSASSREDRRGGKRFAHRVDDGEELRAYVEYLFESQSAVLIQKYVPGHGVGVAVVAHEGKILSAVEHRRIHETIGYGSTYRMTVPLTPAYLDAARALMRALDYTGVAMIEFRVDEKTGRWVLIEINGRFWGSLPLAVKAGADLPWYLYRMRVQGAGELPQRYAIGVRSRHLPGEVRWMHRALVRRRSVFPPSYEDDLGWVVERTSRWGAVRDLLRAMALRDGVDTFARDDPAPFRFELASEARTAVGWLLARLGRAGRSGGARPSASSVAGRRPRV